MLYTFGDDYTLDPVGYEGREHGRPARPAAAGVRFGGLLRSASRPDGDQGGVARAALARAVRDRRLVNLLCGAGPQSPGRYRDRLQRSIQTVRRRKAPLHCPRHHSAASGARRAVPLPDPPKPPVGSSLDLAAAVAAPAAGQAAGPSAESPAPGPPAAERRQLTVLFCDLVDSTQLAGHRDPKTGARSCAPTNRPAPRSSNASTALSRSGSAMGSSCIWAGRRPMKTNALRAVRTGLGLLEAMGPLNTAAGPRARSLPVRTGIHTGLVVVGDMGGGGRQERLALGDNPTLRLASRDLATPNTVVISAATFRLVEGYCTVEDLGPQTLKGVTTPQQVYRVVGVSCGAEPPGDRCRHRPHALDRPGRGCGARCATAGRRAGTARGRWCCWCGEAGIGKSRLVEELTAHVRGEGARRMLFRCSPYHTHSASSGDCPPPATPTLAPGRGPRSPGDHTGAGAAAVWLRPPGRRPPFAALLAVPLPEHYPPLMLSPQRQQQQTQEALVAWLLAEAERQPALAVWEDLHLAAPSSLDFLSVLIEQTPTAPLLTPARWPPPVCPALARAPACDPAHAPPLPPARRSRRGEGTSRAAHRFPPEVVQQIVAKTDGVPLFVEELTKTIVESGLLRETAERYELEGPLARARHSHDLARRTDGPLGSAGHCQRPGAAGRHHWSPVCLCPPPRGCPTRRGDGTGGSWDS